MSLRTSAHTGAAIRVPAEMPGKTVVHRANSQLLRICREELLFVLCCCKENGLPRRFAPRNDMQKVGRCARVQGRNDMQKLAGCLHNTWALPVYCRKASLQSQTRCRLQHVIANQCAHWCGNPRPRRNAWQADCCSGKFVVLFVFAQSIALRYVLPQGERIATSLRSSQ